jgi:hypothetical protein
MRLDLSYYLDYDGCAIPRISRESRYGAGMREHSAQATAAGSKEDSVQKTLREAKADSE